MSMEILAIIPARGGSKGISNKNIRIVAGEPLIAHMIYAAQKTKTIDRIIVSTDCRKIESVSKSCGAEVMPRPENISGDTATSEKALLHVLQKLKKEERYCPDLIVFLQCTSPLTQPEDIDGTVAKLIAAKADTAFAAAPFHYFLWKRDQNGDSVGINHEKTFRLMRQEQEPQYLETGAIYVIKAKAFQDVGHRFFGKTAMYVMPPERCWEIDEPLDLQIAEMLIRRLKKTEALNRLPGKIEGIAFDFDGVFSDNRVTVSDSGSESVTCSRSDGWGVAELNKSEIPMVVISTEKNPIVTVRCRKLNIECMQGVDDKLGKLHQWATKIGADLKNLIFVGNDVNDRQCLENVGCPIVVNDAHPKVLPLAKIILKADGGKGAIRELADMIAMRLKNT